MSLKHWPPKDPGDKIWATFNYSNFLQTGETITAAVISVDLLHGVDAAPAAILDGASQILTGNKVLQKISGGIDQAVYLIKCTATISSGVVRVVAGRITVDKADGSV